MKVLRYVKCKNPKLTSIWIWTTPLSRVLTANTNTPSHAREELILIRKCPGVWSLRRFAASVSSMLPANQLKIQGKEMEQEKSKGSCPLYKILYQWFPVRLSNSNVWTVAIFVGNSKCCLGQNGYQVGGVSAIAPIPWRWGKECLSFLATPTPLVVCILSTDCLLYDNTNNKNAGSNLQKHFDVWISISLNRYMTITNKIIV